MKIQYANVPVFFGAVTAWFLGLLVNAVLPGKYAVRKDNGKYVTFNPDGSYGESDTIGAYETVTLDDTLPLFHIDSAVPEHPDMHLQVAWKAA